MGIGEEKDRPHKTVVYRDIDNTFKEKKQPLSDDEWEDYLQREHEHAVLIEQLAATEYLRKREAEYDLEITPKMNEAIMKSQLENDNSLLNELRDKKKAIDDKYPEYEK